jgi:hypothetical protein
MYKKKEKKRHDGYSVQRLEVQGYIRSHKNKNKIG